MKLKKYRRFIVKKSIPKVKLRIKLPKFYSQLYTRIYNAASTIKAVKRSIKTINFSKVKPRYRKRVNLMKEIIMSPMGFINKHTIQLRKFRRKFKPNWPNYRPWVDRYRIPIKDISKGYNTYHRRKPWFELTKQNKRDRKIWRRIMKKRILLYNLSRKVPIYTRHVYQKLLKKRKAYEKYKIRCAKLKLFRKELKKEAFEEWRDRMPYNESEDSRPKIPSLPPYPPLTEVFESKVIKQLLIEEDMAYALFKKEQRENAQRRRLKKKKKPLPPHLIKPIIEKKLARVDVKYFNADYHRFTDGFYSSYWMGKFINMFIRKGKKKLATKNVAKALIMLKYELHKSPILLFLELLEYLKPVFRLRKYITRRVIVKQYPYPVKSSRRYATVVRWVAQEIKNEYNSASSEEPLYSRVFNKLLLFKLNPKKHSLTKLRTQNMVDIIAAQFNMRFNWKRKKRYYKK